MNYHAAFNLLDISNVSFSSRRGGGGGVGGSASKFDGWANKDMSGNSSVAQRNRRIWSEQAAKETRESFRHDLHAETIGSADAGDKDAARDEYDRRMAEYDASPQQQKEAYETYRPDLSSNERNNRQRAEQRKAKENAREAIRDYVREQKAQAEKNGEEWTNRDTREARKRAEELQKQDDIESESLPETQDRASDVVASVEQEPEQLDGGGYATQASVTAVQNALSSHIADTSMHYG